MVQDPSVCPLQSRWLLLLLRLLPNQHTHELHLFGPSIFGAVVCIFLYTNQSVVTTLLLAQQQPAGRKKLDRFGFSLITNIPGIRSMSHVPQSEKVKQKSSIRLAFAHYTQAAHAALTKNTSTLIIIVVPNLTYIFRFISPHSETHTYTHGTRHTHTMSDRLNSFRAYKFIDCFSAWLHQPSYTLKLSVNFPHRTTQKHF